MPYTVPKLELWSDEALHGAVQDLLDALDEEILDIETEDQWKQLRDRWLARKNGILTQVNDLWLKAAPKEAKRIVGGHLNEAKGVIEKQIEKTFSSISSQTSKSRLDSE